MMNLPTSSPIESKEKLREFLLHSRDTIIDFLRTLDHPKRLEILALLYNGNVLSFRDLEEETRLQKSALSNHLAVLINQTFIQKSEKGIYHIAETGTDILEKITKSYIEARVREQENLIHLFELIGRKMDYISEDIFMTNVEIGSVLKIVQLPAMKVVSFHCEESESPEIEAKNLLSQWAKPKGLLASPQRHQVYGFNNPNPVKDKKTYGYEFWITIPDNFEVEENMAIKDFSGGLYAVMSCRGVSTIASTWATLVETVKKTNYRLVNTHQWLEHHVDPMNEDYETFILDLNCPIKE